MFTQVSMDTWGECTQNEVRYFTNRIAMGNTPVCVLRSELAGNINVHVVQRSIYSRFSSNSEANASELLENIEEMFPSCVI